MYLLLETILSEIENKYLENRAMIISISLRKKLGNFSFSFANTNVRQMEG